MCATSSAQDQQGIAASLHVSKQYSSWYRKVSLIITLDYIDIRERRNGGLHAAGPDRKWLWYPPKLKVNPTRYSELSPTKNQTYDDTFLNHTSKLLSRMGMNGASFWPERCVMLRKYDLSS